MKTEKSIPPVQEGFATMHLHDAIRQFLSAKDAAGRSPHTISWYRDMFTVFTRWLDEQNLGERWFMPETFEQFYLHERGRGMTEATIAGHHRALHILFRWLQKRRIISRDVDLPTSLVEPPRVPDKPQNRVRLEEYLQLLDSIPRSTWIDHRDRLMVATLFLTGIRRSELIRLEIKDFDYQDRRLVISRGKGGAWRDVPLLPAVVNEFSAYMLVRPACKTSRVFLSANIDGSVRGLLTGSGLRQRLEVLCKRADLRMLNPHAFRHGLAIHLLNNTPADMSLIQRVLGHKRITTTAQQYARWDGLEGVRRQYEAIMGAVTGAYDIDS